jgi:hypothetical protein
MFVREDWRLFCNIGTLSQKAGVPQRELRALVLKEIMDNALDAAPDRKPQYGTTLDGFYFIQDDGEGIPGSAQEIAALFSPKRPLTSSKLLRVPSRGALGNGIRVITGSVIASDGALRVHTRGRLYHLNLHDSGTTTVMHEERSNVTGTRIEIKFGDSLPKGRDDWHYAKLAADFGFAMRYEGRTSAWWYDSDAFYELLQAAGPRAIKDLIQHFDGFGTIGSNAFLTAMIADGMPNSCNALTREQADLLLKTLRTGSTEISPKKIGRMIEGDGKGTPYARKMGTIELAPGRGEVKARLPFVVEAMARPRDSGDDVLVMVNGTPITGEVSCSRYEKSSLSVFGCGLAHRFPRVSRKPFFLLLNVTVPYMPVTTDGKEPDLSRFLAEINEVIGTASRKLRAAPGEGTPRTRQADIISHYLKTAIAKVSDNGVYRFSLRQLYYAIRPYILAEADEGNLDYGYFGRWVSEYEATHGEISGIYRDPRGTLYHPHTGETRSIGTIAVEEYRRPEWLFNKILYIEKEGLFEVLKQRKFPERYDCALLSSKGFASRAVRDLIDLLPETGEEIHVFAIHDADGPGTSIYESLVKETIARGARKMHVHNLGLEPWEGVRAGLQVETFDRRKQRVPVARYIKDADNLGDEGEAPNGQSWEDWLQTNRIELNAMTSPQFVGWLEAKFDALDAEKKIVPPEDVIERQLREATEKKIRDAIVERILQEQDFDGQVKKALGKLGKASAFAHMDKTRKRVATELEKAPAQRWTGPVDKIATEIAGAVS